MKLRLLILVFLACGIATACKPPERAVLQSDSSGATCDSEKGLVAELERQLAFAPAGSGGGKSASSGASGWSEESCRQAGGHPTFPTGSRDDVGCACDNGAVIPPGGQAASACHEGQSGSVSGWSEESCRQAGGNPTFPTGSRDNVGCACGNGGAIPVGGQAASACDDGKSSESKQAVDPRQQTCEANGKGMWLATEQRCTCKEGYEQGGACQGNGGGGEKNAGETGTGGSSASSTAANSGTGGSGQGTTTGDSGGSSSAGDKDAPQVANAAEGNDGSQSLALTSQASEELEQRLATARANLQKCEQQTRPNASGGGNGSASESGNGDDAAGKAACTELGGTVTPEGCHCGTGTLGFKIIVGSEERQDCTRRLKDAKLREAAKAGGKESGNRESGLQAACERAKGNFRDSEIGGAPTCQCNGRVLSVVAELPENCAPSASSRLKTACQYRRGTYEPPNEYDGESCTCGGTIAYDVSALPAACNRPGSEGEAYTFVKFESDCEAHGGQVTGSANGEIHCDCGKARYVCAGAGFQTLCAINGGIDPSAFKASCRNGK